MAKALPFPLAEPLMLWAAALLADTLALLAKASGVSWA